MFRRMRHLALLVVIGSHHLMTQSRAASRIHEIRRLAEQLHWAGTSESRHYERTKAAVTQRLLKEVDNYVDESFRPEGVTPRLVMQGLDSVLGYRSGDTRHSVAFDVRLPSGRFLVLGIEVARGGPAIPEDVISFRAYRADEDRLTPVANSGVWEFATDLYAQQLPPGHGKGEFWFLGSAIVTPSQAPPMVAIRLYAFDGTKFAVVWVPPDSRPQVCRNCVQAARPKDSFTVIANGFVVNKLFDPTGHAAHSPTVVIHDQFTTTPAGAIKEKSWRTERR